VDNANLRKVDMILKNGYLLTMNKKREIYLDGAIAIHGDVIVDVGTTKDILKKYSS